MRPAQQTPREQQAQSHKEKAPMAVRESSSQQNQQQEKERAEH